MSYKSYKSITRDRDEKLLEIFERIYWPAKAYERRRVVHAFRRCLTPKWFEKYVERYFALHKWYGMNVKRRADDSKPITDDHWVDIEWMKQDENWNWKGAFVQCKRYSWVKTSKYTGIVGRNDIAIFLWNSQSPENRRNWPVELVFATTSYLEKKAESEAVAQNISSIDCVELARIDLEEYPLSCFIKDLLTKGKEGDRELFLDWEYVLAYYDVRRFLNETTELSDETKRQLEELKVELKEFSRIDSWIENPIIPNRFEARTSNWSNGGFRKYVRSRRGVRREEGEEENEWTSVSFGGMVLIWIAFIIAFWAIVYLANANPESRNRAMQTETNTQTNANILQNADEKPEIETRTHRRNIPRSIAHPQQ